MSNRAFTSRRFAIIEALVEKLKDIDGTGDNLTNLYRNVSSKLLFWDEITDFPSVHVTAGSETRQYQGAGYKDRFLSATIRCYVNEEDSIQALEALIEDIETNIENNSRLFYTDRQGSPQYTHQISIVEINTDEGTLSPLGVGEILLEIRY